MSHALVQVSLLVQVCLPTIECLVYPCVPSTRISGRFDSRLLNYSPTVSNSSFLNIWSSRHGVETLNNCSIVLFANSQYRSTVSSHVLPCRTTKRSCSREISLSQVTFQWFRQRFGIRTIFSIRQSYIRSICIRVECTPSTHGQERM